MDDVLTEMRLATDSLDHLASAQRRHNAAVDASIAELWNDNAELRDALLALANRLESVFRAVPLACTPDESGGLRDADA